MITLAPKRRTFTLNIAKLIIWGNQQGYGLAMDQVKRTQAEANANAALGSGIAHSLHLIGLAADILLYDSGGEYQKNAETYKPLGDYWKNLHELNRWGGDFKSQDANHFSMEYNGVK